MELATRTFDAAGQTRFAQLSGDTNPLHMDPIAARRTQMGACVVHGMHAALWALDTFFRQKAVTLSGLQIKFLSPIYLGETAIAAVEPRAEKGFRITISVEGAVATTITARVGEAALFEPLAIAEVQAADWPSCPAELDVKETGGQQGAIKFAHPAEAAANDFPALCRSISPRRVAAMIALSRLVGMICPGMYSILQGCSLALTETKADEVLQYSTLEVSERMRFVRLAVGGPGIRGDVAAFCRTPPVAQPAITEIAPSISGSPYAGDRALIIGGSRGLGEVVAKACAAGGAEVHITYAMGAGDAARVADEITRFGASCRAHHFDVRVDIGSQLAQIPVKPTHLYYFASPPMLVRRAKFLNTNALADFLDVFTHGFLQTCEVLVSHASAQPLRAFYPSSHAVADAGRGLTEYAMAKAAGEALCQSMNDHFPGAHIICRRLPRLRTDQTATIMSAQTSPVLGVMLPIVNEMHARKLAAGKGIQADGTRAIRAR